MIGSDSLAILYSSRELDPLCLTNLDGPTEVCRKRISIDDNSKFKINKNTYSREIDSKESNELNAQRIRAMRKWKRNLSLNPTFNWEDGRTSTAK